jgi:hypothetical protein
MSFGGTIVPHHAPVGVKAHPEPLEAQHRGCARGRLSGGLRHCLPIPCWRVPRSRERPNGERVGIVLESQKCVCRWRMGFTLLSRFSIDHVPIHLLLEIDDPRGRAVFLSETEANLDQYPIGRGVIRIRLAVQSLQR